MSIGLGVSLAGGEGFTVALIRGHHSFDDHFAQIPNAWLRDRRLSLEARGLLAQIMSHAPGWNLSIKSISAENDIGRDKVRRILNELFEHGYLERSEKQTHDEKGRLTGFDYVTKDPEGVAQKPTKANPTKVIRPPKKTISQKTREKEESFSRTSKPQCADDYEPSDAIRADFEERYVGLRLDVELEKFRDHHMANGSRFKDWDRAFRKWLRQASEWSREARAAQAMKMQDSDWEKWKLENGYE